MTSSESAAQTRLLEGRTALVAGGSRGIGAACARALGGNGAAVAVNYFANRTAADGVVADIEELGSKAVALQGDVSDGASAAGLVEQARAWLGDVDILVCSASGAGHVGHGPITESIADVEHEVSSQLRATLHMCSLVIPAMKERKSGSIVFIGSTESRSSAPSVPPIAIAKAAQDALMRVLAAELGPFGIRVNTVAPGLVPTDGSADALVPGVVEAVEGSTPLRRLARAEDVGGAVVALAGDLGRHVTGAYLPVDGGRDMH